MVSDRENQLEERFLIYLKYSASHSRKYKCVGNFVCHVMCVELYLGSAC